MSQPPTPASAQYQALLQLLRTADTVWNSSRLFFQPWNLSPSQFNVLNLLNDHPDGLSQTSLSRELIMHRSNTTGLLDRLEQRGLVVRKKVDRDRRAHRVVLTTSGEKLIRQILPLYYGGAERLFEGIPISRAHELTAFLKKIAERAEVIARQK